MKSYSTFHVNHAGYRIILYLSQTEVVTNVNGRKFSEHIFFTNFEKINTRTDRDRHRWCGPNYVETLKNPNKPQSVLFLFAFLCIFCQCVHHIMVLCLPFLYYVNQLLALTCILLNHLIQHARKYVFVKRFKSEMSWSHPYRHLKTSKPMYVYGMPSYKQYW